MKATKYFLTALLFSTAASASMNRAIECVSTTETTAMNRFTVQGTVEISDKSLANADLTITTQMAGKDTAITDAVVVNGASGTARTYAAKSLGANEVTLVRLKADVQGRTYHLTVASGLTGPQSTLIVQGIPFRAECKLK